MCCVRPSLAYVHQTGALALSGECTSGLGLNNGWLNAVVQIGTKGPDALYSCLKLYKCLLQMLNFCPFQPTPVPHLPSPVELHIHY